MGVMRFVTLVAVALSTGCFWATTKSEGQEMRKQITALDSRIGKQEESVGQKVKTLDESIEKATKLLARNSADLGTQVDKFSEELAKMSGQLALLTRTVDGLRGENAQHQQARADAEARAAAMAARLEAVERSLGIKTGPGPSTMPAIDKAALLDQAFKKLSAAQYPEARRLYRLFVQHHPQDDKADDAQYAIGETFNKEKNYEAAIAEYQKVIDTYPNGDLADDAYLAAGTAALDSKECLAARAYLSELVRKFPRSPLVKTAKQRLEYVGKKAKDKAVCKPA